MTDHQPQRVKKKSVITAKSVIFYFNRHFRRNQEGLRVNKNSLEFSQIHSYFQIFIVLVRTIDYKN